MIRKEEGGDFPGGPVAKTLPSQYRVPRFDPWSWLDPTSCDLVCMPQLKADEANIKKKKKKEEESKKKGEGSHC